MQKDWINYGRYAAKEDWSTIAVLQNAYVCAYRPLCLLSRRGDIAIGFRIGSGRRGATVDSGGKGFNEFLNGRR